MPLYPRSILFSLYLLSVSLNLSMLLFSGPSFTNLASVFPSEMFFELPTHTLCPNQCNREIITIWKELGEKLEYF